MKTIIKVISLVLFIFIAGCSSNNELENKDNSNEILDNKEILNASIESDNSSFLDTFNENLNLVKFNSDLTSYEENYLKYYQNKYPLSKIYFMKTEIFKCENCYDLYYKKDREILLIKIRDNKILQENIIKSEQNLYIKDENMCKLFQGTWNSCPKICPTDEEICLTQCAPAKCEFDETKIIYKTLGEVCGGFDMGDCEYGFTCVYKTQEEEFGICSKK